MSRSCSWFAASARAPVARHPSVVTSGSSSAASSNACCSVSGVRNSCEALATNCR